MDRETWDRAQERLAGRFRPGRTAANRRRYLLTGGLAVCDACGARLISSSQPRDGRLWPAYACPHPSRPDGGCGHLSVLADRLEEHVIGVVGGWLADPEFARAIERAHAADQADAAPLRAELDTVEAKLRSLAEEWAAGNVIEVEDGPARRILLARRDALTAALAAVPTPFRVDAAEIAEAWEEEATVDERREMMRSLVQLPIRVRRGPRADLASRVTVEPRASDFSGFCP